MFVFIFITVNAISCIFHDSLQINAQEYSLMHYAKLIREENFTAGHPLGIVLPLAEELPTNKYVGYLIEELQTSGPWPKLVFNISYKVNGNMYTEINKRGSYIILISGLCEEAEKLCSGFRKQLLALPECMDLKRWKQSVRFFVPVMANGTYFKSTNILQFILSHLWNYQVSNAAVPFLKSNEHAGNHLQQNTTVSAQGTHLELHTWYPYENSERCNPAKGTVLVKVFTVRNLSDIRRSDVFKRHFYKNLQGCPVSLYLDITPPPKLVNPPKRFLYKDSAYQDVYKDGWDIKLLRIIRNT